MVIEHFIRALIIILESALSKSVLRSSQEEASILFHECEFYQSAQTPIECVKGKEVFLAS
jgi:hypothetical protein